MCNHEWKIIVSYNHPYLMSKKVVCKKCVVCGKETINYKSSPSNIFDFAQGFIKPKTYKRAFKH